MTAKRIIIKVGSSTLTGDAGTSLNGSAVTKLVDVVADLNNYWPLLNENGIMFGDDYWISDVRNAVNNFAANKKIKIETYLKNGDLPIFWLLRK